MKCPRCQTGIASNPDPAGFMVCPGCGARLRRTATQTAQAILNARHREEESARSKLRRHYVKF